MADTVSYTTPTVPLGYPGHHDSDGGLSAGGPRSGSSQNNDGILSDESSHSPIINCMLAGGFGGMVGDSSMHSLDTVKTRQQGFANNLKYKNMIPAYRMILKEEGFFRGLYGGYTPAIWGSLPSTAAFFGTYEFTKRKLINDFHLNETFSYFISGVLGDMASSVFYVPSEVLKTRLQLQGKYNNPFTKECGYNYRGLIDAINTIYRVEGPSTFVFGYKETLLRDLPFSALQFAFYERFRQLAISYNGSDDLYISQELVTGASAGGLAGVLTTPLDVVKTRIQTATESSSSHKTNFSTAKALASIYKNEGIIGMFSGVTPRFIWTGIQSSIMLLLYQMSLKQIDAYLDSNSDDGPLSS